MPKSYCVICGKERKGLEVEDDFVLESMRWFKRNVTRNERGNRLVVCREDYAKYVESRSRYESRQRIYVSLGIVFVVLALVLSPRPLTALVALFMLVLFYLFSLLSYTPKISIKEKHNQ